MAHPHIHTYKELNEAIRKVADIPSRVDDEGFILADGVSLVKHVYDPANGHYELYVQDKKNGKYRTFDSVDDPDFVEEAARCFVEFYRARQQVKPADCMADFRNAYDAIRNLQTSLVKLVESVPGVSTSVPVTTVKFLRVDTELPIRLVTARRDVTEITVFESFFPEGDTKYMCGIRIGNGKDDGSPVKIFRSSRESLQFFLRNYTGEPKAEPVPEQDVNRLKYLMSDIGSILARNGASLDAVPGGLRLRTGEPGKDSVTLALVEKEEA